MNSKCLILLGCVMFGVYSPSWSAGKIISCPSLSLKQYGTTSYYDRKSGHSWNLTWLNKQTPVWKNILIPQTTMCGKGKTSNGIPVTYQCAVFQCKSDAVVASLGQNQTLKCFSAYVSTQNTFYCDSFSTNSQPKLAS